METNNTLPKLSAIILEEQTELTLSDVSHACAVQIDCIVAMVEEGVLAPRGREPHRWRFDGRHMYRAGVTLRLHRDLGVNFAGAALVLQLLDEINALQTRLRVLRG